MDDKGFKELVKIAAEKLKEDSVLLLKADEGYQQGQQEIADIKNVIPYIWEQ